MSLPTLIASGCWTVPMNSAGASPGATPGSVMLAELEDLLADLLRAQTIEAAAIRRLNDHAIGSGSDIAAFRRLSADVRAAREPAAKAYAAWRCALDSALKRVNQADPSFFD